MVIIACRDCHFLVVVNDVCLHARNYLDNPPKPPEVVLLRSDAMCPLLFKSGTRDGPCHFGEVCPFHQWLVGARRN
eukprot:3266511-Pyramimonas_sp.AAC.1